MIVHYRAYYRLETRPYALSHAFGSAGRKQLATIGHAATARRLVRLKNVWTAVESSSAAAIVMLDLTRLSDNAAATGNPAITPAKANAADAAAEVTCLALPTTPGAEGTVLIGTEYNLGITATASTINPPPDLGWVDLLHLAGAPRASGLSGFDETVAARYPIIRPGTAEGWAVIADASAAATLKGYVILEFTEEGP